MKLIVHIGARKTGTTSVQKMLKKNTALLVKEGVFITNSFNQDADNIFADHFLKKESHIEKWRGWLDELKTAMAGGCDRALITSESLTDLTKEEIQEFANFFRPYFDEFQIIFYVRRQDIVATSHYSTSLRGGGTGSKLMSNGMGGRGLRGFQYLQTAECWESVFGLSAIKVRVFPDPRPAGWDTVNDFIPLLGLKNPELLAPIGRVFNSRLSAIQAAMLCHFNIKLGDAARKVAPRLQNRFLEHIQDLSDGDKVPQPSREAAQQFYKKFQNGNRALKKKFLPDLDGPLFSSNFGSYPLEETPLERFFDEVEFNKRLSTFENGKYL